MVKRKSPPAPLREHVKRSMQQYLQDMDSTEPEHLYRKLLDEIEPPLIEAVLDYSEGNQSRAARILGMTRNTLRSKLRRHAIKPL